LCTTDDVAELFVRSIRRQCGATATTAAAAISTRTRSSAAACTRNPGLQQYDRGSAADPVAAAGRFTRPLSRGLRLACRTTYGTGTDIKLYGASPAICDHAQCYLLSDTGERAPRLDPSHAGRYSIYLPHRDGRLS